MGTGFNGKGNRISENYNGGKERMNKKEILDILNSAKDENGDIPMRLVKQAFDKLSEPCEDTISRQAAIDVYGDWYVEEGTADGFIGTVKQLLEGLPSAQPERKTGRWILYDKRFPWMQDYKCSECGNYLDFSGVNAGRGSANFCPNCGADMRGEQE